MYRFAINLARQQPLGQITRVQLVRALSSTHFKLANPMYFTKDHEWIQIVDGNTARIGITSHAADNLGEITYLGLDELEEMIEDEESLEAGEQICEVESVKSAAGINIPVSGKPVSVNDKLSGEDGKVMNSDPEGSGYLCEIEVESADAVGDLMDKDAYAEFLTSEK